MSSNIHHRSHRKTVTSSAFLASALFCAPALACDVALVLAIDVSGSVDAKEYRLQADGLSDALGDPVVSEALVNSQALVAVIQWSGIERQEVSVEWTATETHQDVMALREEIEAIPRAFRNYSTGIGDALSVAIDLHEAAPRQCRRKVIDVSGDGPSNEGAEPKAVHARLDAADITVNGLAIEGSEDGIRDFCLSRGLGDVYKRQRSLMSPAMAPATKAPNQRPYTHASMPPTSRSTGWRLKVQRTASHNITGITSPMAPARLSKWQKTTKTSPAQSGKSCC